MSAYEPIRSQSTPSSVTPNSGILSGSGLISASIGVVAGLVLGLIVGWVIWPVQWTNAWPVDLSPEAKAHYLAAVAESYAYYGDDAAAAAARARLNSFGDELTAEIAAAQEFYRENPSPNSRVYISYLGQMATQLGLESPAIVSSPEEQPQADSSTAQAEPAATSSAESTGSWLTWILSGVAALLLIGGGIYVITRLSRVRQSVVPTTDPYVGDVDEFEDEYDDEPFFDDEEPSFETTGQLQNETPPDQATYRSAPAHDPSDLDQYQFDEEDENNLVYSPARSISDVDMFDEDQDIASHEQNHTPPTSQGQGAADGAKFSFEAEPFDHIADDLGDNDFEQEDIRPLDESARDDTDSTRPPNTTASLPAQPGSGTVATATRPRTSSRANGHAVTPSSSEPEIADTTLAELESDELGSFVSTYQLGIPDFDEFFNITDEAGRQVGGCGMGVNMKRGSLPNHPDCAIALDVWLMERSTTEAQPTTQTRLMLSEYVVEHNMEKSMTRDMPQGAPPPLVAQPGLTFHIKGAKIILDCTVTDVRYVEDGPLAGVFETLEMEMSVRSRS